MIGTPWQSLVSAMNESNVVKDSTECEQRTSDIAHVRRVLRYCFYFISNQL